MKIKKQTIEEFQKEQVKLIESSNVNFLIGSGISADILSTLYDVEELIEFNNDLLINVTSNTRRTQIESLLYWRFFQKSIFPLVTSSNDEIEKHMSEISIFLNRLYRIIERKKDQNLEKQINLFTTNYDLFIENAIENNGFYYNDGFLGRMNPIFDMSNFNITINKMSNLNFKKLPSTYFNIIKFHGSLNWNKNIKKISYDNNFQTKLRNLNDKYAKHFHDVYGALEKLYSKEDFKKQSISRKYNDIKNIFKDNKYIEYKDFINEYKDKLLIVNPTKEKFSETVLNLNYHEMLRLFSTNLEREHVTLFVFGFSFSDEHILKITERSLINPELKIVIFAYNVDSYNNYLKIFEQIKSSNMVTILFDPEKKYDLSVLIQMYENILIDIFGEKAVYEDELI